MKSVFFASVSVVTDDFYGRTWTLEGTYLASANATRLKEKTREFLHILYLSWVMQIVFRNSVWQSSTWASDMVSPM
jgi:hypothetical protein